MRFRLLGLILVVAASVGPTGCTGGKANMVVSYLEHADRQYETGEQRAEMMRALHDMLEKSPAELREERYADYQGHPGVWPVTTLLERYFVPTRAVPAWDSEAFYRDVAKPEAKRVIREQLSALERETAAH